MNQRNNFTGAILAGGTSRRMFPGLTGGDKALLDLAGKPMLAHVIDILNPQVGRLVLSANGDATRFFAFGLEVIADDGHEFVRAVRGQGPLSGLLAAMVWASRQRGAAEGKLISVSSDVPFLPTDLVARLSNVAGRHSERPAIAVSDGQRHPTIALWPLALAEDLAETLANGDLSADRFAKRHGAIEVSFPMRKIGGDEIDPFFNANTPDDLALARRVLESATET